MCDWEVDSGPPTPSVRVTRLRPGAPVWLDSFSRADDGSWMVPNAHAGDQLAEAFSFFGKPAWKGEHIVRMFWFRARTKNFTGIYAGSGGLHVTLVQFAPDLFVQLANPPDDTQGDCQTFCASLRLGARAHDLP